MAANEEDKGGQKAEGQTGKAPEEKKDEQKGDAANSKTPAVEAASFFCVKAERQGSQPPGQSEPIVIDEPSKPQESEDAKAPDAKKQEAQASEDNAAGKRADESNASESKPEEKKADEPKTEGNKEGEAKADAGKPAESKPDDKKVAQSEGAGLAETVVVNQDQDLQSVNSIDGSEDSSRSREKGKPSDEQAKRGQQLKKTKVIHIFGKRSPEGQSDSQDQSSSRPSFFRPIMNSEDIANLDHEEPHIAFRLLQGRGRAPLRRGIRTIGAREANIHELIPNIFGESPDGRVPPEQLGLNPRFISKSKAFTGQNEESEIARLSEAFYFQRAYLNEQDKSKLKREGIKPREGLRNIEGFSIQDARSSLMRAIQEVSMIDFAGNMDEIAQISIEHDLARLISKDASNKFIRKTPGNADADSK